MMTPEERKARRAESARRYASSAKGKATAQRYRNSAKGKATKQRYQETTGGFRWFIWREENREKRAAQLKAWKQATGYKTPPKNRTEARVASERRKTRRRYIARAKDRQALDCRIAANIESVVPRTLPTEARTAVIAAMAEAIYTGELPIGPKRDDAKPYITAHFRMFTNYGPISLDAARFDNGRGSLHDTISEGMWA